jgi:hypothetical protein
MAGSPQFRPVRGAKEEVLTSRMVAAIGGVALVAGALAAQELPQATVAHGGFAFPDQSGTRLILLSAPERPLGLQPDERDILAATGTMKTAFCSGGARRAVGFSGHQPSDRKGNGRQHARQFAHLDGFVFGVKDGGPLGEGETCFVAADSFARAIAPIRLDQPAQPGACGAGLERRIAAARNRGVTHCWTRAGESAPGGVSVLLVEFARQGNSALASLVVADEDRLVFADQPGDYSREGGGSVWRVDDGGTFDPRYFTVVLLARRGGAFVLATSWAGAEGTVLGLYASDGDRFRQIVLDAWYQSPV